MENFKENLKNIKALVFDVDGVCSSNFVVDTNGDLMRSMNAKDGFAIKTASDRGMITCIITGGTDESVKKRFERIGVKNIYLASKNKVDDLNDFCKKFNLQYSEILYMGDDIPDHAVLSKVGIATCPADAVPEIQAISHYISDKKGGEGCVRDVIEQVMRMQGKWFSF